MPPHIIRRYAIDTSAYLRDYAESKAGTKPVMRLVLRPTGTDTGIGKIARGVSR